MTRDEMIERQIKATGFTRVACTGFIDQLAGAGLVKLDEPPPTLWELLRKHNVALDRAQAICNEAMICGVKPVEK